MKETNEKRFQVTVSNFLKIIKIIDTRKEYIFDITNCLCSWGSDYIKVYFYDKKFNDWVWILSYDVKDFNSRTIYNTLKNELNDNAILESVKDYSKDR